MADYRPRARSWTKECPFCGCNYNVTNFNKRNVEAKFKGMLNRTVYVTLHDTHQIACFNKKYREPNAS